MTSLSNNALKMHFVSLVYYMMFGSMLFSSLMIFLVEKTAIPVLPCMSNCFIQAICTTLLPVFTCILGLSGISSRSTGGNICVLSIRWVHMVLLLICISSQPVSELKMPRVVFLYLVWWKGDGVDVQRRKSELLFNTKCEEQGKGNSLELEN